MTQINPLRDLRRRMCLEYLEEVRPVRLSDAALEAFLRFDAFPTLSNQVLRRDLDYLALRGLLTIRKTGGHWLLRLTAEGVDISQGCAPYPDGSDQSASYGAQLGELQRTCDDLARQVRELKRALVRPVLKPLVPFRSRSFDEPAVMGMSFIEAARHRREASAIRRLMQRAQRAGQSQAPLPHSLSATETDGSDLGSALESSALAPGARQ